MAHINEVINNILSTRYNQLPELNNMRRWLINIQSNISQLQSLADSPENNQLSEQYRDRIHQLIDDVSSIQQATNIAISEIDQLHQRFSKKTINIGVAGRSGQGKSTLLQQISGLSDDVIPSSAGVACTGAKSKIIHIETGEAYAEIEFFSEIEFIQDILSPYFKRLGMTPPSSILNITLTQLSENSTTSEEETYKKLKSICDLLPKFKDYLNASNLKIPLNDPSNELKNYITQTNGGKHYAVKVANIYTKFPKMGVKTLGLIDLPGLEATQLHENRLITSLKYDVDALILMKRPDELRAAWEKDDIRVIDLIESATNGINLNHWLFLVFNQLSSGANKASIDALQTDKEKPESIKNILVADCTDYQEVLDNIFAPVLNHLELNLANIDLSYIKLCNKKVSNIQKQLMDSVEQARIIFSSTSNSDAQSDLFDDLFEDFFDTLENNLSLLVNKYSQKENNSEFASRFKAVITEAHDYILKTTKFPTANELSLKPKKDVIPVVEAFNHLRSQFTKEFSGMIDKHIINEVNDGFSEVITNIFPNDLEAKIFGTINVQEEPFEALAILSKKIEEADQQPHIKITELYHAIEYIRNFNFSYQSHFHYRVRKEMLPITPINDSPLYINVRNCETFEEKAKGIEVNYRKSIGDLKAKLTDNMSHDLANALYALVEEIEDRLTYGKEIKRQWKRFTRCIKGEIWSNEFGAIQDEENLRQKWLKIISDTESSIRQLKNI